MTLRAWRRLAGLALLGVAAVHLQQYLVALLISENGTLFGFSESGYRTVVWVAIAFESLTVVIATPVAVASLMRSAALTRPQPSPVTPPR